MTVKNVEKLEKSRVAIEVTVGAEEFEAAVQKAYLKTRNKINVPGFRRGKAPRKMIEKMFGAEVFYADAVDEALPDAYAKAVEEKKLDTIGYPEVELVGDVTKDGYTFKATVAVYPDVKLGKYKGISAPKEEVKVTADDVKERLNEMAERNARLVSVDRKAKKGDTAVIDFEGFLDGKPFAGGKGENHELELGSGSFVPGFEDQVIGMKAGEEKDIDITFPEDYHKDLAGKAVVFKVKCSEVKVKELPELDDEFAKDVSEFDTIKELKDDIKKQIEADREKAVRVAYENALIEKVADTIDCEIPDILVEEQCKRFLEEFKSRIMAQGIPYDQYKKMTGMNEEKFMEDGREPALRQVKMDLAISQIIDQEKLEATDEEIEEEYKKLSGYYGMDVEMVKKYLDTGAVRTQVLNNKAVAVVVDNAKPEKAGAKKAEAKAEDKAEEKKPAAKKAPAKKAEDKAEDEEKKPAAKKTAAKKTEDKAEEKKPAAKKPAAKKTTKKAE
ncbi:MAG: trigger factor [Ruminococcaceae bacterium]|jgi:trigger factor|nr:trigger factor [Oscillospiraceae bacterium]